MCGTESKHNDPGEGIQRIPRTACNAQDSTQCYRAHATSCSRKKSPHLLGSAHRASPHAINTANKTPSHHRTLDESHTLKQLPNATGDASMSQLALRMQRQHSVKMRVQHPLGRTQSEHCTGHARACGTSTAKRESNDSQKARSALCCSNSLSALLSSALSTCAGARGSAAPAPNSKRAPPPPPQPFQRRSKRKRCSCS